MANWYYVYDPGTGELKTVDYSDDTADISFAYDRLGRQKQITDAAGTRTFAYNNSLQPESESITGIYNETLTRTYEDGTGVAGRNSGFALGTPDSPEYAVIYGYGTEGRFSSVNWNAGTENGLVNYSYMPNSDLLSGYSSDSGIKTVYEYEPHRSLKTSVTNSFGPAGSETVISRYGYFYDSIGRRTSVKNTGTAFAQPAFSRYGYNDRSELTSSERYRGTEITDLSSPVTPENRAYQYDPIGNRKESVSGQQQALIYETNVLNRYTEISQNAAPVAAPEYDDDGNILKYKDKVCQWNAENRLISVQPQNPAAGYKKITFLYDYMGRRVRKQVFVHNGTDWNTAPESEKLFVHDGWNMVKESTVTGGAPSAKYYVWGLDLSQSVQGAGGIGGLLCSLENTAVLYYFYDANGNTAQVVNAADGTIAAHYEYDAFGNTVTSYGAYADANPFRFSTKYFDGETGLYYYGFRYYSPELGRWWSRDPLEEHGGLNLYGFVWNNSINGTDVLGGYGIIDFFKEDMDWYPPEAQAAVSIAGGFGQILAAETLGVGSGFLATGFAVTLGIQGANNIYDGISFFSEKFGLMEHRNVIRDYLEENFTCGTLIYYSAEVVTGGYAILKQGANTLNTIRNIIKNPNMKMKDINNIRETFVRVTKQVKGKSVIGYEWKKVEIITRTVFIDFKNRVGHIILIGHDAFQLEMAFFPALFKTLGDTPETQTNAVGKNSEPDYNGMEETGITYNPDVINSDIPHKIPLYPKIPHKKPKYLK